MARVRWSLTARRDLRALREYIEIDSAAAARLTSRRIVQATRHLANFPRLGRVVPEQPDGSLREVIVEGFRVVYTIRGEEVLIVRVVRASRDVRRISFRED